MSDSSDTEVDIVAEGGILIEEEKEFQWKINNFETIMKREDFLKLQKYEFEFVDSNGVKLYWKTCMKYGKPESEAIEGDVIHIYIELKRKRDDVYAEIAMTVEDSLGNKIFEGDPRDDDEFRYVAGKSDWTIGKLRRNSQGTSVNGALIITFTLKVFTVKTPSLRGDQLFLPESEDDIIDNRKQEIYLRIAKLENDKENSDVKIISSDGKEFYAYRWILSEASEVFKDMLNRSEQSEAEPKFDVVKVDDVSGTTMKILLHFIYTGKLDPEWSLPENVAELVYAANKFEIEDLKNIVDDFLGKLCTTENAGTLLALAENASMKKAVADILAFIKSEIKCKDPQKYFNVVKQMKND